MSGVLSPIPSDWSPKDPADNVWYGISFENLWGVMSGDSVGTVTSVTCSPSDLAAASITIGPSPDLVANQVVSFKLSGGSVPAGQTSRLYQVTVTIYSTLGQTIRRSELLRVQTR
jgi:hypothetical protein